MSPVWKNPWEIAALFAFMPVLLVGVGLEWWVEAAILTPICGAGGILVGSLMTLRDARGGGAVVDEARKP